jgi:ABC-2 type transport system permease protein
MTNESGDRQEQDGLKLAHKAEAVTSTGAARAHTWRNIGLIVEREYKTRVRQRSFVITTIVLLALVGIAAFIPTISQYLASRGSAPTRVVVVNNVGIIAGLDESALESYMGVVLNGANTGSSAPYTVVSQPQSDLTDLQAQVKNGKLAVQQATVTYRRYRRSPAP